MTEEEFQYWLFDMDDVLERFLNALPAETRDHLDYSPRSLDALETWILERYATPRQLSEPSEYDIVDGLARYIGETFRQALGGVWTVDLGNPQDAYYGLPQLVGFRGGVSPQAPVTLATASAARRTGTYLSTVLRNCLQESAP
jgi:hypothetical protein